MVKALRMPFGHTDTLLRQKIKKGAPINAAWSTVLVESPVMLCEDINEFADLFRAPQHSCHQGPKSPLWLLCWQGSVEAVER